MITYNHEKFIAQAIESVMMQEAGFGYELVIGEDCSTDRTREICIDYQRRFPNRIRLLLPEKNLGMMHNFVQTLNVCTGQYVALLEGDDYWTTPHKLQKQADFLDAHSDYALCFARTVTLDEGRGHEPYYLPPPHRQKDTYTVEDLLQGNMIGTCAVMLRNGLVDSFPDWYFQSRVGDWPLYIMAAQHGKVGYIHELMATYRIHAKGVHSSQSRLEIFLLSVDIYKAIDAHLGFEYRTLIGQRLALTYQLIFAEYLSKRDCANAYHYAIESIKTMRNLPLKVLFAAPLAEVDSLVKRLRDRKITSEI